MIWLVVPVLVIAVIAFIRRDKTRRHGTSGSLGHAMQNLEGLFVESKKHVIEVQRDTRAEEDESGDPPEK